MSEKNVKNSIGYINAKKTTSIINNNKEYLLAHLRKNADSPIFEISPKGGRSKNKTGKSGKNYLYFESNFFKVSHFNQNISIQN